MRFIIETDPIAKARHRTKLMGRRVITYDPQSQEKYRAKYLVKRFMKDNDFKSIDSGPISMCLMNYVKIPDSLSSKQKKALEGTPCDKRPDIDNYFKFWADVLNEISYGDDRQITSMWSDKVYSSNPRIEIYLNKIYVGNCMINEHALTLNGEIKSEELKYMVQKANRLGMQNRQILNVFTLEDAEGKHVYFETEPLVKREKIEES